LLQDIFNLWEVTSEVGSFNRGARASQSGQMDAGTRT